MVEKIYINNKEAHGTFGLTLAEGALTTLLTPPPMKQYIENKSAMMSGKQVYVSDETPALVDERDFNIAVNIASNNSTDIEDRIAELTAELQKGIIKLKVERYEEEALKHTYVFNLLYKSCSQLQTFFRGSAKFLLSFNEPDPTDRA